MKAIQGTLCSKKAQLEVIQKAIPTKKNIRQRLTIEKDINKLLEQEEDTWYQRARVNWLQSGDKNTKFFHSYASSRRRKNLIIGVQGRDGTWETKENAIKEVFLKHFTDLFSSQQVLLYDDLFFELQGRVSESLNVDLI